MTGDCSFRRKYFIALIDDEIRNELFSSYHLNLVIVPAGYNNQQL